MITEKIRYSVFKFDRIMILDILLIASSYASIYYFFIIVVMPPEIEVPVNDEADFQKYIELAMNTRYF